MRGRERVRTNFRGFSGAARGGVDFRNLPSGWRPSARLKKETHAKRRDMRPAERAASRPFGLAFRPRNRECLEATDMPPPLHRRFLRRSLGHSIMLPPARGLISGTPPVRYIRRKLNRIADSYCYVQQEEHPCP
jgi:hypothetical protein